MKYGFRTFCVLFLALLMQACTFAVKESMFVRQDETVQPLNESVLAEIRGMREGLEVERISVTRPDGTVAHGLWLHQPGAEKVLLYFGGNAMRIADSYRVLPHLLALETDVVWLDHRGMGASSGEADLASLLRDGLHSFDYVAARTGRPVVLHGLSLGSFIAGHVAIRRPAAGLILEASATNATDWASMLTPWYAKPFVTLDIDPKLQNAGNEGIVQQYRGPLFILVGEDDETTPVELNRGLYEQAVSTDRQFFVAENKGHGGALVNEEAKRRLRAFIRDL